MVTVTDRAKEELKRTFELSNIEEGKYLRLTTPPVWTGGGDFGIVIDEQRIEDHILSFQGFQVLLVDEGLAKQLSNSVLDFKDTLNGPGFTLDVF